MISIIITTLPTQLFATEARPNQIPIQQVDVLNTKTTTPAGVEVNQPVIFTGKGFDAEFKVVSKWQGAFNAEIKLTNTGSKPIENWLLNLGFDHDITNIWNSDIKEHKDHTYTLKNKGWNADIQPGQSVTIGFLANYSDFISAPTGYSFPLGNIDAKEQDYGIDFKVISDWGQAFNAQISITNNTDKTIEDWTLAFDFDRNIQQFWTARIESHEGNHYVIKNAGWNANIEPGQTLELGFAGNPGNVDKEPSKYKLSYIGQDEQNDEKEDELKDTDEDELNNLEEYLVGTNPYSEDTDCDGLKDGEEAHEYETDPLLYDTDKDGIGDGDEIKLGLNPLSQYTHGNILDSEYQIDQTIAAEDININEEEDKYKFSLDITASGCIESNMYIVSSAYDDVVQVNDAILGGVLDLMYTGGDVTEATLKFQVEESYIDNSDSEYAQIDPELVGVKRYNVFKYFEEDNILLPVKTYHDVENNMVYADVDELGTYCVMDLEKWFETLGILEKVNEPSQVFYEKSINKTNVNLKNISTTTMLGDMDANINMDLTQTDKTQDKSTAYTMMKLSAQSTTSGRLFDENMLYSTILIEDFEDDIFDSNWMYLESENGQARPSYELPEGASMPWKVMKKDNNNVGYCNVRGVNAYIDITEYEKVYLRFRYKLGRSTELEPIPTWHEIEMYYTYDPSIDDFFKAFKWESYQDGKRGWNREDPQYQFVIKQRRFDITKDAGFWLYDFNDVYIDDFEVYGTKIGEGSGLRVKIEAPEMLALTPTKEVYNPNPFEIKFNLENLKNSAIKNVKAVLSLPEGVKLIEGDKEISIDTLDAHEIDNTSWKVMAEPSTEDQYHTFSVTYYADGIERKTVETATYKPKKFPIISSAGLTEITLDETPEYYDKPEKYIGKPDKDDDGLKDGQEINWHPYSDESRLLNIGKLPTLGECMKKAPYIQEGFNRLPKELKERASSICILPILSHPNDKDGDKDGIPDLIDLEKLKKNTIETMFPLPNNNEKTNAVYVNIDNNRVNIVAHIRFEGDSNDKFPNSNDTYAKTIEKAIEEGWNKTIIGGEYDFMNYVYGVLITDVKLNSNNPNQEYTTVRIKNNKKDKVIVPWHKPNWWSFEMPNTIKLSSYDTVTKDYSAYEIDREDHQTMNQLYKMVVAHEFGHVCGMADAYDLDLNSGGLAVPVTNEVPWKDLMRQRQWPYYLTENDIEMVLQAFHANKLQFFYDRPSAGKDYVKSKVIREKKPQ